MKIVQVLPALQSGGVERGTLEVARHLVLHGHQSIVISAGGCLVNQLISEGSKHIKWAIGRKSLFSLRLIWRLRRFLEEQQIDVLHVRSRFPAWICYMAWRGMNPATRPKFITTVHGLYSVNGYSAIMCRGEKVIVVSNSVRDYVLKHYQVEKDNLKLIYRGVSPKLMPYGYRPTPDWLNTWYKDHPETKNKILLTLPGRLSRLKGQIDFIQLIASLKQSFPDIHGVIVGEVKKGKKAYLEQLKQLTKNSGTDDCITFAGHRSDIREVIALSDIVLSLTRQPEAFGRTTLEALSLGKPVLGYAHGGVEEQLKVILPSGRVDVGNIQELSNRASSWLKEAPVVPEQNAFSLQQMLDETLCLYTETSKCSE